MKQGLVELAGRCDWLRFVEAVLKISNMLNLSGVVSDGLESSFMRLGHASCSKKASDNPHDLLNGKGISTAWSINESD
jgi:hypothetical protein